MFPNAELEEKFNLYLKSLKPEDKIALLFHSDADGVCSGVILAKTIEILTKNKPVLYFSQGLEYAISEKTVELVKNSNCNKFMVVDMAVDTSETSINNIKKIEAFAEILVLDHHELTADLNSEKITFVKVVMLNKKIEGTNYPASKLAYDLCNNFTNIKSCDWISCVGLIGDRCFNDWKDFVNATLTKYNLRITETGPENTFGKIGALISAAKTFNINNLNLCFDVIYNASSPRDVINSELKKFKAEIDSEMNKYIEGFKTIKDENGLYIYEIKPKFPLHSPLSTILSMDQMKPDETLVIIADNGGNFYNISARRQDGKSNMSEFLKSACRDIPGSYAGGHIPAAGGTILRKDMAKFKSKLMQLFKERNGVF